MGTWGGKIGFTVALAIAPTSFLPILDLVLGDCVFEQGCGTYEPAGFAVAALFSLGIAAVAGLAVRTLVNRLMLN